jgi:hypothetical protein
MEKLELVIDERFARQLDESFGDFLCVRTEAGGESASQEGDGDVGDWQFAIRDLQLKSWVHRGASVLSVNGKKKRKLQQDVFGALPQTPEFCALGPPAAVGTA